MTILLSIQNITNPDVEFIQTAITIIIGVAFWFAVLMMYWSYYLDRKRQRNESTHQEKMKKWKQ